MYRAVTWKVLKHGLQPTQTDLVVEIAGGMQLVLKPGKAGQQVFVDGIEVTDAIRSNEINRNVSLIAAIPQIRGILVHLQQQMAASKGIVMDGRDIGTHVLPDAEVKIFLTASVQERAERRYIEMADPTISLEQLTQEIAKRDQMDEQREASPLIKAEDAHLLDSTKLTLLEVVDQVLSLCRSQASGG